MGLYTLICLLLDAVTTFWGWMWLLLRWLPSEIVSALIALVVEKAVVVIRQRLQRSDRLPTEGSPYRGGRMSAQPPGRWVTQQEAAQELGISTEAVRMRVRRGSLESRKDEEGRVVVWVVGTRSEDRTESVHATGQRTDELVGEKDHRIDDLQEQVRHLQRLLEDANTRDRESRRLLAAALERIPELESGETQHRTSPAEETVYPEESTPETHEAHTEPETGREEPADSGEGDSSTPGLLGRLRGFWRSR